MEVGKDHFAFLELMSTKIGVKVHLLLSYTERCSHSNSSEEKRLSRNATLCF